MRRTRAFSMVELVVAIAIITTVAGIGAVRFARSAERSRVDAAARRIVSMIDDARTRARTRSDSCKLAFISSPFEVQIKGPASADATLDTVSLARDPYRLENVVAKFDALTELEFTAFGRPVAGGTVTVTSGSFTKVITVDPETGRATLN